MIPFAVEDIKERLIKFWKVKRKRDSFFVILAFCIITFAVSLNSCSVINNRLGLKDDHPVEQFAEDVFEQKLGLEEGTVDLTPE